VSAKSVPIAIRGYSAYCSDKIGDFISTRAFSTATAYQQVGRRWQPVDGVTDEERRVARAVACISLSSSITSKRNKLLTSKLFGIFCLFVVVGLVVHIIFRS
jgi:hypothetical protein